ncbi:TolC family protein [Paraburkholderia heleia]|uniref:TolC family protein n=1 Tax=Paraburkholderia heleia TaxID=634127 RepID=UPI002AB5FEC3|nr:TolC family protein [Paraburkholderia heleia]
MKMEELVSSPDYDESVEQLIEEVKHAHPGVLAAQAQYEAAGAKVDQTRAQGMPTLSLVGKYSRDNQPTSLGLGCPIYPATGYDAYVGIQISIPLFEGFGRHYQVRQAEAEAEHAQDVVDETVQQVALDVWTSWQALRTATRMWSTVKRRSPTRSVRSTLPGTRMPMAWATSWSCSTRRRRSRTHHSSIGCRHLQTGIRRSWSWPASWDSCPLQTSVTDHRRLRDGRQERRRAFIIAMKQRTSNR